MSKNNEALYPRTPAKSMAERSRKRPIVRHALLVALSAEVRDPKGRPTQKLRLIVERLVNLALAGEPWAVKEILDRVDGKPTQMQANDPDNPLPAGGLGNFIVEYVKSNGDGGQLQLDDEPETIDITPVEVPSDAS